MALKFRKSVTVFPGFKLNFSKSGMSATVGMKGMSVNLGSSGTYLNVGLPGTGLYDRIKLDNQKHLSLPSNLNASTNTLVIQGSNQNEIEYKSFNPELVTSEGLFGLKEAIIQAKIEKHELLKEKNKAKIYFYFSKVFYIISCLLIFGFFIKWPKQKLQQHKVTYNEIKKIHDEFGLEIEFNLEKEIINEYIDVKNYFHEISKCQAIWDVKTSKQTDKVKERTIASNSITREKVSFEMAKLDFINSKFEAIRMNNIGSSDLYIYPGFVLLLNRTSGHFGLVDFREINLSFSNTSFVEDESVPTDSKVIGKTWRYANKNGSPDKRFNNNHEIPMTLYNKFFLNSKSGINECYMVSNYEIGSKFCEAFDRYIQTLKKLQWSRID